MRQVLAEDSAVKVVHQPLEKDTSKILNLINRKITFSFLNEFAIKAKQMFWGLFVFYTYCVSVVLCLANDP